VGKGNLVITVSKALKKYAEEYLKVPEEKIRVVYNGIDDTFLDVKKTRREIPTVGMIARLSAWKGHFFFLEAVKKVREAGISVNALIVGSGSEKYRDELKNWISANNLDEAVKIVRMDGREALENIDILVVPSLEPEGFGRTVVEAQMSKTPVIGTNIGAVPELIEDGKTGFLVEPGNSVQLADKISVILNNPGSASSLTNAAFDSAVQNFTVSQMVEKTLAVYDELLKE
jgi:glycosyltransferase involved in cell wall biosynthesis